MLVDGLLAACVALQSALDMCALCNSTHSFAAPAGRVRVGVSDSGGVGRWGCRTVGVLDSGGLDTGCTNASEHLCNEIGGDVQTPPPSGHLCTYSIPFTRPPFSLHQGAHMEDLGTD